MAVHQYKFRDRVDVTTGFYSGLSGVLMSYKESRGAEGNQYLVLLETGGSTEWLGVDGRTVARPHTKKVWIPGRHLAAVATTAAAPCVEVSP